MNSESHLLESALITFFAEAKEMLQQMEDALLSLENDPDDPETINALFRAVHTIKGSAGLFDLEHVVSFTHQVESVIGRVRAKELEIDALLSDVLLKSVDVIASLLNQAEDKNSDTGLPHQPGIDASAEMNSLAAYLDHGGSHGGTHQALSKPRQEPADKMQMGVWHISLRFGADAFRNGFDPVSTIQYLRTIGDFVTIVTIDDRLPEFTLFDPETCYLGFELRMVTAASRAEIEAAFEFVHDDCTIRLFAPASTESDFVSLIQALPEEIRLGDILVDCGAVSKQTIERALQTQQELKKSGAGEQNSTIGEILVAGNNVAPDVINAALEKQSRIRGSKKTEDSSHFVRVPADKLDALINLVGEMVICGASAGLQAQNLREANLIETTQQMSRLVEEIRNGALALRMVQISETFGRFRRVVRDIAGELGKKINLEIDGAETELDKSVVEKIGDPLMHLVRNALDHGIETPEQRIAAGKPATAIVRLSAHHNSAHIVICVSDDGRGIDGEKVLMKAKERGLVQTGQILTEQEKLELIFAPGFSTAEAVTNLSGRGVGMDVVKKNIEALRGKVILKSILGQGTTIEIRLPLTLAIIDGFLVKVGNSYYVVPQHEVVECIAADDDKLSGVGDWAGNLDLRAEVLPFLYLRKIFGIQDELSERRSIVVVKSGDISAGLVVDQLLGEYQTVIKPLGKLFKHLRGISGSTVLGSGEVALILDVPALVQLATEHESQHVEKPCGPTLMKSGLKPLESELTTL